MKKTLSLFLCVVLFVCTISGCTNSNSESYYSEDLIVEEIIYKDDLNNSSVSLEISDTNTDSSQVGDVSEQASSQSVSAECAHKYQEKIKVEAKLYNMGKKEYTCVACGDNYTKDYCIENIKILSISNSYGKNALWQLYDILKAEGVKNIDIAVMYVGGCSIDMHWENIQNNKAEYEVFRNNNGGWKSTKNCTIDSLLSEGDWDIITTQNSSGLSGKTDGYQNLNNLADYIKGKCPNSELIWHLIWGYQNGSEWLKSTTYNGDENFMFESILNCTKDIVIPSKKFDSVAPVGTAILNARTSSLKNMVHDPDGSHLSPELGYYVAAFAWYCHITGASPYDTCFASSSVLSVDKMNVVLESVENAIKNPYKITQSYYNN